MDVKASLGQRKCPNYTKAVFINTILHPRVFTGLTGTLHFNSTTHFFDKNLLAYRMFSSINPNRNKFDFGFTSTKINNAPEKSGDHSGHSGSGKVSHWNGSTLEMEMDQMGKISSKVRYNVFGNLWTQINTNVLANWSKTQIIPATGLVEWVDDKFNIQVSTNKTTNESNEREFKMNFMRQLSDHWMLGGQCTFAAEQKPSLCWLPRVLKGYEGMLGYQKGPMTYVATLDHSLSAALRVMARINSNITACVEVKHDLRENKSKSMWSHRIVMTDKVEVKGQIDTDGTITGSVFWNFMKNFTVSLSTKLNRYMNDFGMGVELSYTAN
ncbi:Eukaryotic porin/Tom40 [Cinara cedri]|uniref:Eukaryotic porin/Tom40 n=1 Tax=Cinara cedri TaxID=506608 RepID=A0A5E4MAQ3_9HEMI|nr:Eukaryotic porin/Tom40 [Cinara cedri]